MKLELNLKFISLDKDGCISILTDPGCGCCGDSYHKYIDGTSGASSHGWMVASKEEALSVIEQAKEQLLEIAKECDVIRERVNSI